MLRVGSAVGRGEQSVFTCPHVGVSAIAQFCKLSCQRKIVGVGNGGDSLFVQTGIIPFRPRKNDSP